MVKLEITKEEALVILGMIKRQDGNNSDQRWIDFKEKVLKQVLEQISVEELAEMIK